MAEKNCSAKGSIVLLETPGGERDAALVAGIARLLPRATKQQIAARIAGPKPLQLILKVPEAESARLLAILRELGAKVTFEHGEGPTPVEAERPAPPVAAVDAPAPIPPAQVPPAKPAGRTAGRRRPSPMLLAALALACVAAVVTAAVRSGIFRHSSLASAVGRALPGGDDPPAVEGAASFFPPWPSVSTVPPQQLMDVYRAQHAERPDGRFARACETLVRRWEQLAGVRAGTYRIGRAAVGATEVLVPLLRGREEVARVRLPLPASFGEGLRTLESLLAALEGSGTRMGAAGDDAAIAGAPFRKALQLVGAVDPRAIVVGLAELDTIAREGVRDPRLLQAAARGYGWLTFVLSPDRMELADPLAAEGLAFLVLAKHGNPRLQARSEEALLAGAMGYRGHAAQLLDPGGGSGAAEDALVEAYLRRDAKTLAALRSPDALDQGSELAYYLLARLYRELGLRSEAQAAALELLERSRSYPALLENISSGDIGLARRLTVLYPLDLLGRLEDRMDPSALAEPEAIERRLAALAGDESQGEIALGRFEQLLEKWRPFDGGTTPEILIDDERARRVFRVLYIDALALRFRLLLHQWGVVEGAQRFADSLAAGEDGGPLVLSMQAEVAAALGQSAQAQQLAARVVQHPDASAAIAYAMFDVMPLLQQRVLYPPAARHFDGRPSDRYFLGYVEQYRLYNLEAAARCYERARAADPYLFHAAELLALARGTPEALEAAAAAFPSSYELAEALGDFRAYHPDRASQEQAVAAYRAALQLAPSRASIVDKLGRTLANLDRYREAVEVYDAWLARHDDEGLGTIVMQASRAWVLVRMGKPAAALASLENLIDSYQGGVLLAAARANEKLGRSIEAAKLYRMAVERYPSAQGIAVPVAAFMWREGDDRQAAQILARVRPQHVEEYSWYADEFDDALGATSRDRVLAAVAALREGGATAREQISLAHWLERRGRGDLAAAVAVQARSPQMMENLQSIAAAYGFIRRSAGEEAASKYFAQAVDPSLRGRTLMLMYTEGEYEGVLREMGDPGAYPAGESEFLWLQAQLAWLSLDRPPGAWAERLQTHYAGAPPGDYYFAIGAMLQGALRPDELLASLTTPKQRCEIPYYIGLASRLAGDFATANAWYQLVHQTGLENNGEYHWAGDELFTWSHFGMAARHRFPREDKNALDAKMAALDALRR